MDDSDGKYASKTKFILGIMFKILDLQGAKKIIFSACHSGKLMLAFTSPDIISTSPQNFLTSRIDFTVLLLFEFLKKCHLPVGKLKTEFVSPIAKSISPGLLDTTFFAHWFCMLQRPRTPWFSPLYILGLF